MPKFCRDWKESWVDQMGLIVALSGAERFSKLTQFKIRMKELAPESQKELMETLRMRFTPTNGDNGCREATSAVREALKIGTNDAHTP